MPTYDYRCNACDHEFELFQSMSEPVKRTCPKCGKRKLERLIGTGAALLFKGSGFYETDYRSESYKKAQSADKPEPKSDSKGENKSDSKPDKGPDKKPEKKPDAKPDKKPKAESA
jgi:putative FmdB family regulatory protein